MVTVGAYGGPRERNPKKAVRSAQEVFEVKLGGPSPFPPIRTPLVLLMVQKSANNHLGRC